MNDVDNEQMENGLSDRDFGWEGMSAYRRQRHLFVGRFGLLGPAKDTNIHSNNFLTIKEFM
jgi:hypothetical protein